MMQNEVVQESNGEGQQETWTSHDASAEIDEREIERVAKTVVSFNYALFLFMF